MSVKAPTQFCGLEIFFAHGILLMKGETMSIMIGDIDLVLQGLNNEYQINRILEILNLLSSKGLLHISPEEMKEIDIKCMAKLQEKYPNSGVTFNNPEVKNAPQE